ncbi:alpha-amylase family glycosyl hydrolase, partial [Deinococcus pimensis]|uniref:alpha-amylase family glycosyl hydrolase n=1 Tax=Deinococcus pimensis TaxID=309888 RepID=UPI00048253E7
MHKPTALTAALVLTVAGAATPSWKGEIVYQVMPDRFANGDPTNDRAPIPSDPTDPKGWHGGDLRGLTARIPYIKGLGATAIWLTPVYRQVTGRDGGATGYHGYWPNDFRDVDPHFGTLADFDAFVKAAHDAGLKVMLDQVVNHYGPAADAVTRQPAWFNDPATCAAKGDRDVYCPIYGLPDLNQDRPDVRDLLFGNADFWRARGVDGFRYDAIKHVPQGFLKDLLARDAKAGTYTLGEFYDADAGTVADYQKLGFASLFDFSLKTAMNDAIMSGRGLDRVTSVLERYREIPAPDEVALFLDNHDVPRFANGALSEDDGRERTVYGLRALMTLRGVPVVWQGTEIAMRGGGDPDNRRDMRFED